MDLYAVLGRPVEHSLSPFLFQTFAKQTGQGLRYDKITVDQHELAQQLNLLAAQGYKGLNITLPLKELAYQLAAHHSNQAKVAHACNILTYDNQAWTADNVDGIGLIRDLTQNKQIELANKRILLIGAGGAARGALAAFRNIPSEITIVNRTSSKAIALAQKFNVLHSEWQQLNKHYFDLVINASSASLQQLALPLAPQLLRPKAVCYDMVYGQKHTAFAQWAKEQDALHYDGWGMLVEQAAQTFYQWRAVMPDTQALLSLTAIAPKA